MTRFWRRRIPNGIVSEYDRWQNKHYDKCLKVFDRYLNDTNVSTAPWYLIDAQSRKWAQLQVLEILCQGIDVALQNRSLAVPLLQNTFPLQKMPKLSKLRWIKLWRMRNMRRSFTGFRKSWANCITGCTVSGFL